MIKDTKMHEGLSGKEMRNFYQETLVTYYAKELANSKKLEEANIEVYTQKSDDKFAVMRMGIKLAENNLAFAQEDLKLRECRLGLLQTLDVGLNMMYLIMCLVVVNTTVALLVRQKNTKLL